MAHVGEYVVLGLAPRPLVQQFGGCYAQIPDPSSSGPSWVDCKQIWCRHSSCATASGMMQNWRLNKLSISLTFGQNDRQSEIDKIFMFLFFLSKKHLLIVFNVESVFSWPSRYNGMLRRIQETKPDKRCSSIKTVADSTPHCCQWQSNWCKTKWLPSKASWHSRSWWCWLAVRWKPASRATERRKKVRMQTSKNESIQCLRPGRRRTVRWWSTTWVYTCKWYIALYPWRPSECWSNDPRHMRWPPAMPYAHSRVCLDDEHWWSSRWEGSSRNCIQNSLQERWQFESRSQPQRSRESGDVFECIVNCVARSRLADHPVWDRLCCRWKIDRLSNRLDHHRY